MKGIFLEIDSSPAETEELLLVSLDDHKFGVPDDYLDSAGLEQLSTFFIGYLPRKDKYYVVQKGKAFTRSELPQTDLVNEGLYYNEIAGAYVASGSPLAEESGNFKIPCQKYDDPSEHLGGQYVDETVKAAVTAWGAEMADPIPKGLTEELIYQYTAVDNRSLKPSWRS